MDYRALKSKAVGLDGVPVSIAKALPDEWLDVLPACLCHSASLGKLALSIPNVQKLVPLPK
eukprot:1609534-Amphidinium_carterae.1